MSIQEIYRGLVPLEDPKLTGGLKPQSNDPGFKAELEHQLRLSQHAETRIRSRGIPWSREMESRISNGIEVARAKGSQAALILADNVAVIANVSTKTVVTALTGENLKGKVFTNIDSAVVV